MRMMNILPILVIVLAFIFLAPFFLDVYNLGVLRETLMWAALTASWFFFSGLTKYISLGSAAFFGTGLYFTALYLEQSIFLKNLPALPLPIIVVMAGLLNFAIALAIGLISLRLKGIYFAIATLALGIACQGVFNYIVSDIMKTYYTHIPPFDLQTTYYTIAIAALVIFIIIYTLYRSNLGFALRMIGENEDAAIHFGVNASLTKTIGFALSAMCIGLMGGCYTTIFTVTAPTIAFNLQFSFMPPMMAMFGGLVTFYSPIIGAVILSVLRNYLGITFVHHFLIVLGIIIVIIAEFMPEGIVGFIRKIVRKLTMRSLKESEKR